MAEDRRIKVVKTPVQAPKANAIRERFLGSVRRECLDHILILSERQLHRVIGDYVAYFNSARPHQEIGQRIPNRPAEVDQAAEGGHTIVGLPMLGGLHHDYRRVA